MQDNRNAGSGGAGSGGAATVGNANGGSYTGAWGGNGYGGEGVVDNSDNGRRLLNYKYHDVDQVTDSSILPWPGQLYQPRSREKHLV